MATIDKMPLVMIESLGIKRFGSVMGITSIFYTAGAAVSPVVTGGIFDQTGCGSSKPNPRARRRKGSIPNLANLLL